MTQPCPKILTKEEWIATRLKAFPNETRFEAENLHNDIHQLIHNQSSRQQLRKMIKDGDY